MTLDYPLEALTLPFPAFVKATSAWLDRFDWGEFNDAVFALVRALKAHPKAKALTGEHAFQVLMAAEAKSPGILKVPDTNIESESFEIAFLRAWERARMAIDADPVRVACDLAGDGLIKTIKPRTRNYPRFLTVAALLQVQVGAAPILLPVRKLAENFPCEKNSVVGWIEWATEDGALLKTKTHVYRPAGGSRAAEYVFALHRWPAVIQALGDMLGMTVRAEDLAWVSEQFAPIDAVRRAAQQVPDGPS